jgi:uncharacterized membrane protein
MSDLLAVAFTDVGGADDILHKLRKLQRDDLVELEDACVAERDTNGELHLKQAIGERIEEALHPRFWRSLIEHILHHGQVHMPADGTTPELGLDRGFTKQLASSLPPGSSALFLLVRNASMDALIDALKDHPGTLLRTSLPIGERQALSEALGPRPPRIPSAAELSEMVSHEEEEKKEKIAHEREAAEAERKRRLERFKTERLAPSDISAVVEHFVEAARRGEKKIVAYRFPSDLYSDHGRAINNNLHEWPDTLVGQPRQVYEYWRDHLRPLGYRLSAKVLDYPHGMPGDVGFVFSWE